MILVTGGTGFVGEEVVTELLALGYRVRLLVRNSKRAERWAHTARVELAEGDALRPETLAAAMKDVAAVIHLIGIIAETKRTTFEQGHVEATRNVLLAAREAGVTRWLQMSAAGTRHHAASRYHQTKWQAEELVRQSGLDWTIFRPSLVYGYNERDRLLNLLRMVLSWPLDTVQLYSFPLLDGGVPLIQPVSVREVAHCFAHGVANEAAIARTFDVVGPVAFSWREMVLKILAALGKRGIYEEIPLLLLLRAVLWLGMVLVPVAIVAGVMTGKIPLAAAEIGAAFEAVLIVVATRWRQVLLFNVPSAPLLMVAEIAKAVAPRNLQFSEQLKMAVEDNIGDPHPAAQTFAYAPESFESGLARIYGGKS